MKILQLTKKFPYPLKDGESIAVTNLSRSLAQLGCEMSLLSMNTTKHFVDTSTLPDSYDHYQNIQTVPLDNRVTAIGAFANLFSPESYHVSRFHFDQYGKALVKMLKETNYDVIQLETLYLAPYIELIKEHTDAKVVMRSHNVEFEIWNRIIESTSFFPKKKYLKYLTKKLKRFEIERLDMYDALVTVTQKDLDQYKLLGYHGKSIASPIGIDISKYKQELNKVSELALSFIGSLDWMPNLDGLDWFLENVWSELTDSFSDISLHIAGRNTPDKIVKLASDKIMIHGEVESAIDFINQYPIMIVPLLSGSGMRVKILEGMALGKVVISTSIGAEGILAVHKKSILIADTTSEFHDCLIWLQANPDMIVSVGQSARKFISDHFDQNNNAALLKSFYSQLLKS